MNDPTELMRADLRDFAGYRSARSEALEGEIWLNANESPWPNAGDEGGLLRRYPAPQPPALVSALAGLYGVSPARLLVGRGSDEAIDLLVRGFCTPGRDAVLVATPSFGMYAVCARLQGARLIEVPMRDAGADFVADLDAIAQAARDGQARLVFLSAPGNPAGGQIRAEDALTLARALDGQALLIIDEAYVEYGYAPSLAARLDEAPNLGILRTLSKAHALAAARIGCLLADMRVIAALRRLQAPYPVPESSAREALRALQPEVLARTRAAVATVRAERERLRVALADCAGVARVYPSQANFLLVRFTDASEAFRRLLAAGVVVRDMRALPQLGDALRITVGTPAENERLLVALRLREAA